MSGFAAYSEEFFTLKTSSGAVQFFEDPITITYGSDFPYVVLWSEEGQDFVCVEPWIAKNDALNSKEELRMIKPKESLNTTISISI
ncbi:hypothetical protein [Neobacillus terrae]|uniref:hypothetical protein n=1 Tax=Neobacillus terrae TaxID=3034837 RepID=UPI00140B769A|nr:hypothetical protein [Neobacillus terrae]NHM31678.1 hypothetical protein [Neobacillus terrae]